MRTISSILGTVFLLTSLWASSSEAQGSDVALARQLFQQGIELADAEDWAQAADRFQRSFELRPSPIVAYNLGSALVELGRLVEASEAFRQASREGAPDEVAGAARESRAEIEPRIGTLTLHLTGATDDVEVFVDARRLPTQGLGVGAPVDPGPRHVRALRDGEEIASTDVEIDDGGAAELTLDIPERAADTSEADAMPSPVFVSTEEEEDEGSGVLASPWLWLGVGAVVVGVVVLVLALTLGGGDNGEPVPGNLTPAVVEF